MENMIHNVIIAQARAFAKMAHGNQKYGDDDYIKHLDDVYKIAYQGVVTKPDVLVACYLHDILEDTDCSYKTLEMNFGKYVAELVYAVTDELGRDRAERKNKTYPKIIKYNDAITIKACDRLANLSACYKGGITEWKSLGSAKYEMYAKEHKEFCEKLNLSLESKIKEHRELYAELSFNFCPKTI